jgi:hypothetical protein
VKLHLNCLLVCSEIYHKNFIYLEFEKKFIEVENTIDIFKLFDEFTVFSYYNADKLTFTDHITGSSIAIGITKNQLIEKFNEMGKETYWNKIKRHLAKYKYSPSYCLEIQ